MSWEKQAGQVAYSAWSRSKPFGGLASLEKTILSSENLPACEQTADQDGHWMCIWTRGFGGDRLVNSSHLCPSTADTIHLRRFRDLGESLPFSGHHFLNSETMALGHVLSKVPFGPKIKVAPGTESGLYKCLLNEWTPCWGAHGSPRAKATHASESGLVAVFAC